MDESELEERLARLERQVAELRRRFDAVQRGVVVRADHPSDRFTVREKVAFDWQS